MAADAEFVVVGAGMAGTATARALARAGREVVLLEQFEVGHKRGSSHGASRIFRLSYPDAAYVRMASASLPLWRELEAECGVELVTATGGFDVGKALDDHAAALRECGAVYDLMTGRQAAERHPQPVLPPDEVALYQPDAGIARAEASVRALVRSATRHGARLVERTQVTALRPIDGGVEVHTDDSRYRALAAVVTAGSWAAPLLATAGIELHVEATRETVAYFRLDDVLSVPTLVEWGDPVFYALASPGEGLKTGFHHAGPVTDPSREGEVDEATVDRLAKYVAARYPSADPTPHRAETCLYTNTADEHFILERRGPIVVGSACSGHGFKFAPLIGRRLAELALRDAS